MPFRAGKYENFQAGEKYGGARDALGRGELGREGKVTFISLFQVLFGIGRKKRPEAEILFGGRGGGRYWEGKKVPSMALKTKKNFGADPTDGSGVFQE